MIYFNQEIRNHLAEYKKTRLGILEDGQWKRNKIAYSHILPESMYRLNILETYRKEFWEYQGSHPEIRLHQDFHHLNSSQALCFNLFFPLLLDKPIQELFLSLLGLRTEQVRRCAFEEILDPKEGTNFDFVIELASGGKVFFEVKYSESDFGTATADARHLRKFEDIYRSKLKGKVTDECLQSEIFFQNYQILRNLSYLNPSRPNRVVFLIPYHNQSLQKGVEFISQAVSPALRGQVSVINLEHLVEELLGSSSLINWQGCAHYRLLKEKYLPANGSSPYIDGEHIFPGFDTTIYFEESRIYLPEKIKVLFIAESLPAFSDPKKRTFFYFLKSHRDLIFSCMMKAVFDVDYHKDSELKERLLTRLAEEKGYFLTDAVEYPINKDKDGNDVSDDERKVLIWKELPALLQRLDRLKEAGHLDEGTKLILLKNTVFDVLYPELRRKFKIVYDKPIPFPRYYNDPVFVERIREALSFCSERSHPREINEHRNR